MHSRIVLLAAGLLSSSTAYAGSLTTTFNDNNLQNGNMFSMKAAKDLEVDSLDINPNSSGSCGYEIYTSTSALSMSTATDSSKWTLRQSGTVTVTGGTAKNIALTTPVEMTANQTLAWYVTFTSCGVRYTNGSSFGAVYASNSDLTIYEGYGKAYAFSSTFSPRVWNGTVYYTTCTNSTWYADTDNDGYGDPNATSSACSQPSGYVSANTDCDDTDGDTFPGADEYCDGHDDDCDGVTDEDDAVDASTWYADTDNDGYGDVSSTDIDCYQPSGYVSDDTDCDDTDGDTWPGADEYCDGHDDDCDSDIDEDDSLDVLTWYADTDSDGYGDASSTDIDCYQPSGYVSDDTDCDDTDGDTWPGADEYCDGHDDDCDNDVDEDDAVDASTWYADSDSDGYGDLNTPDVECYQPSGYVSDATDCDDLDGDTWPGADEYCDGHDDNCDGEIDEDDSVDVITWYADGDGDGFGWAVTVDIDCYQASGWVEDNTDCDDTDPASYPGATEVPYDTVDQDCDGSDLCDVDLDGFDSVECTDGDDCDDEDEDIHVGAEEYYYDGVDQDCDEGSDYDADGDGYDSASYGGEDCDDAHAETYPGAPDDPYDGIVTDCDAADEFDVDGDGYDSAHHGGTDCDDANSSINPGAAEAWYDGVDQDCDGNDQDQDGDGWVLADDCDDVDPALAEDCSLDSGLAGDTGGYSGGGGCGKSSTAPRDASGVLALFMGLLLRRRDA